MKSQADRSERWSVRGQRGEAPPRCAQLHTSMTPSIRLQQDTRTLVWSNLRGDLFGCENEGCAAEFGVFLWRRRLDFAH